MKTCANVELEVAAAKPVAARLSPLHKLKAGKFARVREICGAPDVSGRLREIGFHEGQIIRLIACHTHIVCQVRNSRLALSAALACMILVESLAE
jgi:Fe2+ transport system protein FeoA